MCFRSSGKKRVGWEFFRLLGLPLNEQNNRIWSDSRPLEGIKVPLHDQKVLVRCAIFANRVFGPYFFEESVNKDNYLHRLENYFSP